MFYKRRRERKRSVLLIHSRKNLLSYSLTSITNFSLKAYQLCTNNSPLPSTDSEPGICKLCFTNSLVIWGIRKILKEIRSVSCYSCKCFSTRENRSHPPGAFGIPFFIHISSSHETTPLQRSELQCLPRSTF